MANYFTIYHGLLKRGKSGAQFQPTALAMVSCVTKAKKVDVLKLIGSIGVPQNSMAFYEGIPEDSVHAQCDAESDS